VDTVLLFFCGTKIKQVVLLHSKGVAPIGDIVTPSSNGYFVNITEAKRIHCYHYRGINKLSVTLLPKKRLKKFVPVTSLPSLTLNNTVVLRHQTCLLLKVVTKNYKYPL
jgi:hypothetical protein